MFIQVLFFVYLSYSSLFVMLVKKINISKNIFNGDPRWLVHQSGVDYIMAIEFEHKLAWWFVLFLSCNTLSIFIVLYVVTYFYDKLWNIYNNLNVNNHKANIPAELNFV